MSRKGEFIRSLIQVLAHNKDGAMRTQIDRQKFLKSSLKRLYDDGYQLEHIKYIKQRHIKHLVQQWKNDGISAGVMKNRMSHYRWLMNKLNKVNLIPANDELGIPKRVYFSNTDQSRDIAQEMLEKINDGYMQRSLLGQKLFGLRMEESLKIQPHLADQGSMLFLKASWTKGKRERYIPILTAEQRAWLDDCKIFVKNVQSSLIPSSEKYHTYRQRFEKRCERLGITHRHGLRHLYAQKRFEELASFPCPVKGGPSWDKMTETQRLIDQEVRQKISLELGHVRISILRSYCGK